MPKKNGVEKETQEEDLEKGLVKLRETLEEFAAELSDHNYEGAAGESNKSTKDAEPDHQLGYQEGGPKLVGIDH